MKPSETLELVTRLMEAHPRQTIEPPTMKLYCQMLADLEYVSAAEAVAHLIATCKYFPTVAEIRTCATERATGMLDAGDAWAEVQRKVATYGFHRAMAEGPPAWSNAAVEKAVTALGGFARFCQSEEPEGVLRGQFFKVFDAARSRVVVERNVSGVLPGPMRRPLELVAGEEALPLSEAVRKLAEAKSVKA